MKQTMYSDKPALDCSACSKPPDSAPQPTRRTTKLRSGLAALFTTGACLLPVLTGCSSSDEGPAVASTHESSSIQSILTTATMGATAQASPAPPFGRVEASALGAGLTAGNTAALESVMVLPSGANLSGDVVAGLQGMGPVDFDITSFHDSGDGTATVNATVSGTTWVANLLLVDDRWMLVATEQSG